MDIISIFLLPEGEIYFKRRIFEEIGKRRQRN
jgi:hypothetical protein